MSFAEYIPEILDGRAGGYRGGSEDREVTPDQGERALSVLRSRDRRLTSAAMTDGRIFQIMNIAWGRDDGADFDHVTTNISPRVAGLEVDFFHTREIDSLADEDGTVLFQAS
ncbi:MAG: hypothetical protein WBD33_06995 [Xanthobacteraceae bacterium]